MTVDDVDPMTLDAIQRLVGAPLEAILTVFYQLVRSDARQDRSAIVNPGCSIAELDEAESRIGHTLHPLHRSLLSHSNGGTFPFVGSVSLVAGAVPREREWRIVGPFLTDEERATQLVLIDRLFHPIHPKLLGTSLRSLYGDQVADHEHLDDLIVFAAGYGGEQWGYVRGEAERIDCYMEDLGRHVEAPDFERFLREQTLYSRLSTQDFVERIQRVLKQRT